MRRKKLANLLEIVDKERKLAEVRYKENKKASDQMQRTTRTSWSGGGDRMYAEGQQELNKKNLETLDKFRSELESALEKPIPEKVDTTCFVMIEIDGERNEFFVVRNVANIKDTKIISSSSPMGKAILGKSVSETVGLNIDANKTRAKVLSIQ